VAAGVGFPRDRVRVWPQPVGLRTHRGFWYGFKLLLEYISTFNWEEMLDAKGGAVESVDCMRPQPHPLIERACVPT
jgi:hypothetical protein